MRIKYLVIALFFLLTFQTAHAQGGLTAAKLEWIHKMGVCESGWRPGLKHLDSNNKYSYGALQFQMATWLSYGEYLGANAQNIYDPMMQTIVAAKMLDAGLSYNWKTCFAATTRKYGEYPK